MAVTPGNVSSVVSLTSPFSGPTSAVMTLVLLVTVLLGVLGNSVVCWIVYRKPTMRSAINLLLAHLAVCDICVCVLTLPVIIVSLLAGHWVFGRLVCILEGFLYALLNTAGIYTLLAISLDRFLIIVQRKEKLTVRRAKVIIVVTWTSACAVTLPPTVGWSSYSLQAQIHCSLGPSRDAADLVYSFIYVVMETFTPLLLMLYSFLCVMATVRKKSVRVQDQPRDLSISYNGKVVAATLSTVRRVTMDVGFKTRSFKTILYLFLVLCVCWAPYTLCVMITSVLGKDDCTVTAVLSCVCTMKTAINPLIYGVRIKKFRKAIRELVAPLCCSLSVIPAGAKRKINPRTAYEVPELSGST